MLNSKSSSFSLPILPALIILIAIQAVIIIFFKGGMFLEEYDVSYWKDRYEHSQYALPLSKRNIGDDGLYAYAGYRMAKGDNPMARDPFKPPVGKYLLGLSTLLFGSPFYASFMAVLVSLLAFYLTAGTLFKNQVLSIFLTLLLFIDPLFFSQSWISGLDIFQTMFLLLNFLFLLISRNRSKSSFLVLLSGLCLGFFMQTKPPILAPLIFALEVIYFLKEKKIKLLLPYLLGLSLGNILPYSYYLLHGEGFFSIFKIQKYTFSVIISSRILPQKLAVWTSLLIGKFPHVTSGKWFKVEEWTPLWPVIIAASFIYLPLFFRKRNSLFIALSVYVLLSLAVFNSISFYTRYTLLILPAMYLVFGKVLEPYLVKHSFKTGMLVIAAFLILKNLFFVQGSLEQTANSLFYNLEHYFFQDIYKEQLAKSIASQINIADFRKITQSTLQNGGIARIEPLELRRTSSWFSNKASIEARFTYQTRDLGSFEETKTIHLVKENSVWKIVWDWDLILDGFEPGYEIKNSVAAGKRGRIINDDGKVLIEDRDSYLILVNPEKINTKKEEEMARLIGSFTGLNWLDLQNEYLENSLPGEDVLLATAFYPLSEEEREKLISYPGVSIRPYISRVYYDSLQPTDLENSLFEERGSKIYSATSYTGKKGMEAIYEKTLKGENGGKLWLADEKGNLIRMILEKQEKNGEDVYLN